MMRKQHDRFGWLSRNWVKKYENTEGVQNLQTLDYQTDSQAFFH